ncbi:MAG: type IV secretion protein Dot, partial [Legionella sp.]
MDTTEHTDLGNALRFTYSRDNPYLRTDENGAVYLRMQRVSENGLPEPMALELSAGEIIAMAGDYYTEEGWTYELDLPDCQAFNSPKELGAFLVNRPIITQETNALIAAYNNLAAPEVSRKDIDRIYTINDANYIPFSTTLNFYMQQAMFYLRVKDYGQMLDRNQTHFTPWSIRVYMLGHQLALDYGQLASELTHWAKDSYYQSEHPVIQ